MCGIAGFYTVEPFFKEEDLYKMADTLNHRGPDAEGYYFDETVGLAHKRLSILDLSDNANQPMTSHSRRYVTVYNGEVYNFKEIASELDVNFRTSSDTEVILEAFETWGVTFTSKLNGMFAIAIFDKQENKLYLFRDRIGIKPLYYYWDNSKFIFASELKAILANDFINKNLEINRASLNEFLHLGYIPEPHTIFRKIKKFPSGHLGILDTEGLRLEAYWMIEGSIKPDLIKNTEDAGERLSELIDDSVKKRLISDVPFGSFLSGGIDSSLVTAVAQKHTKHNLNSFSIGFKENKFNEAHYAAKVAKHLGTNHHEFTVSQQEVKDMIPDMINYYDEPYADSSAFPTMIISKMARKHVTVVLSGDGGDELFHGYGAYKWAKRLSNPLVRGLRHPLRIGLSGMSDRYKRASHLFNYDKRKYIKSHIFSQEQYFFSHSEINSLVNDKYSAEINLQEDQSYYARNLSAAENQAVFDLRFYLKDDLLVKVDRASMRYGLETRVPLLDHNIVEFALNLDPKLKINKNIQKYLLKKTLYKHVPEEFFDRPKWGFAIPLKSWLKSDLKYLIDNYLSKETIEKYGVINYNQVKKLKDDYFNGTDYIYNRLWLLIILHMFFEKHKDILHVG